MPSEMSLVSSKDVPSGLGDVAQCSATAMDSRGENNIDLQKVVPLAFEQHISIPLHTGVGRSMGVECIDLTEPDSPERESRKVTFGRQKHSEECAGISKSSFNIRDNNYLPYGKLSRTIKITNPMKDAFQGYCKTREDGSAMESRTSSKVVCTEAGENQTIQERSKLNPPDCKAVALLGNQENEATVDCSIYEPTAEMKSVFNDNQTLIDTQNKLPSDEAALKHEELNEGIEKYLERLGAKYLGIKPENDRMPKREKSLDQKMDQHQLWGIKGNEEQKQGGLDWSVEGGKSILHGLDELNQQPRSQITVQYTQPAASLIENNLNIGEQKIKTRHWKEDLLASDFNLIYVSLRAILMSNISKDDRHCLIQTMVATMSEIEQVTIGEGNPTKRSVRCENPVRPGLKDSEGVHSELGTPGRSLHSSKEKVQKGGHIPNASCISRQNWSWERLKRLKYLTEKNPDGTLTCLVCNGLLTTTDRNMKPLKIPFCRACSVFDYRVDKQKVRLPVCHHRDYEGAPKCQSCRYMKYNFIGLIDGQFRHDFTP